MSSRRSARLSVATAAAIKEDPIPEPEVAQKANHGRKRKNAPEPPANEDVVAPSTPKRKRASKAIPPPVTPTPAAIGLLSAAYSSGDVNDPVPAINRLVVPGGTNAPLLSPETRRVISNKPLDQVSPSKVPQVKTTTANILEEAVAHLIKVAPNLKPVIEKHHCHVFSPEGLAEEIDPFGNLVSGIISQQVCEPRKGGGSELPIYELHAHTYVARSREQLRNPSRPNS